MSRLRRAWAVLRGDKDPAQEHMRYCLEQSSERLLEAATVQGEAQRLIASLRASLDDAHRQHAITSAKAAGLERVLRTIFEAADDGLANPTEQHR